MKGYASACIGLTWIKNKIAGLVSLFNGIPKHKVILLVRIITFQRWRTDYFLLGGEFSICMSELAASTEAC